MKIPKESLVGLNSYREDEMGGIISVKVVRENIISTPYGSLVPRYTEPDHRRKDISSMTFYPTGDLKDIELEEMSIVHTPIGDMEAERLSFYPSGALRALIPSNGKVGAFWTIDNELGMLKSHSYKFPFAKFKAKARMLHFFERGGLRSLALAPGEMISIMTPAGLVQTQVGFVLDENLRLRKTEPYFPLDALTPIGEATIYNPMPHRSGFSLWFSGSGKIERIATTGIIVINNKTNGKTYCETSDFYKSLMSNRMMMRPIFIKFISGKAYIGNGKIFRSYSIDQFAFYIEFGMPAFDSFVYEETDEDS